jgi:hypothetical protein
MKEISDCSVYLTKQEHKSNIFLSSFEVCLLMEQDGEQRSKSDLEGDNEQSLLPPPSADHLQLTCSTPLHDQLDLGP